MQFLSRRLESVLKLNAFEITRGVIMVLQASEKRAPRYKLSDRDDSTVRFVRASDTRSMRVAKMIDLSRSGALFEMEQGSVPLKNETVLFEFKVPGLPETVVWKGRVARIENTDAVAYAGVHFHEMPEVFSTSLERGLQRSLDQVIELEDLGLERVERERQKKINAQEYILGGLLGMFATGALFLMLLNPYSPQPAKEVEARGVFNPDNIEITNYQPMRVKTLDERKKKIERELANEGK